MTKEAIIKSNMGLVYDVAKKFYNVDKQDLIQAGCMGLIDAYNNYQQNGTTKFSTYAYTYVYGKMYETVNKNRDIKVSRDILKLYKLIEKSRYMLAQKIGKIPSNMELAHYLEKDEREIEEAILSGDTEKAKIVAEAHVAHLKEFVIKHGESLFQNTKKDEAN